MVNMAVPLEKQELAVLEGEPDVVMMADMIRDAILAKEESYLADKSGMAKDLVNGVISKLKNERSAKWWCEHRHYTIEFFIELMA